MENFEIQSDRRSGAGELADGLREEIQSALSLPESLRKEEFENIYKLLAEEPVSIIHGAEQLLGHGGAGKDPKTGFGEILRSVMSDTDAKRIERMIHEKGQLEIPAGKEAVAADLLKPGVDGIKVGKTTDVIDGFKVHIFAASA